MVKKKMYQRIQKLKQRGLSKAQISTELGIDRSTVRKYYNMDSTEYRDYLLKTLEREKTFGRYEKDILEIYALNDCKRLNMAAVYDYLEERYGALPGNEQTLRNYIRHLITKGILVLTNGIRSYSKVGPLPYGKQLQIDFGVHTTKGKLKLYIFAAVLSASRYKYISVQTTPFTTIDVIHHLLDCFDYLGGMPEELVIDQDSILVVSENYGDIIYTKKFSDFIEEMDLNMYVCRKSDPESKGKIENVIKYVKYNFLQVRDFTAVDEAQESLAEWLKRRGNGKISQATKKIPLHEIEEEREYLRPLQNSLFRKNSLLGREVRQVSDKSFIMVDTNEYSVPMRYRNQSIEIYKTEHELFIYDEKSGNEIAHHQITLPSGQRIRDRAHFRNNTIPIEELHEQTLQMHTFGGWKKFVQINLKTYARYTRDQCLFAGKHFAELEDAAIFTMALDYCLENKTISMTELLDTYKYLLEEHKQEEAAIQTIFMGALKAIERNEVKVSKRSVSEYETLIGAAQGGTK